MRGRAADYPLRSRPVRVTPRARVASVILASGKPSAALLPTLRRDAHPAEEAAEAPAAADLLAALADPMGYLVAKVRAAAGADAAKGAIFFEAPLAAVKSLRAILAAAKDRPAELRYKPFALKSRLVGVADIENAIGRGLPADQVDAVAALCSTDATTADAYAVIVSVALACGTNVVRGAAYAVSGAASSPPRASGSWTRALV